LAGVGFGRFVEFVEFVEFVGFVGFVGFVWFVWFVWPARKAGARMPSATATSATDLIPNPQSPIPGLIPDLKIMLSSIAAP
jgi:hypothetical protein